MHEATRGIDPVVATTAGVVGSTPSTVLPAAPINALRGGVPTTGWRRALHHKSFAVGGTLVLLLVMVAALSFVWTPHSATDIDVPNRLHAPDATNWLGTDSLGRDVVSLLIVGARNSIAVGIVAVGIGIAFGVALGLLAAARRGWVEEAVMRLSGFTFAFPALLSAIILAAVAG